MKKILTLLLFSSLSGCTLIESYFLAKFDPNEYKIITEIRTDAGKSKTQCDNAERSKINAELISDKTVLFANYSQHIKYNTDTVSASKSLDEIAQGLRDRYSKGSVSVAFCKIKFESIEHSAETMQTVIGNKPR